MTESIAILPDGTIMNPHMENLLDEYGVHDVTTGEQDELTPESTAVAVGAVAVEGVSADAFTTDWELPDNPADPIQVKRLRAMAGIDAHGDDTTRPTLIV